MKKIKMSSYYGSGYVFKQKYLILQMGNERSIIQDVMSDEFPTYIVDNQHLMLLDEKGLIL